MGNAEELLSQYQQKQSESSEYEKRLNMNAELDVRVEGTIFQFMLWIPGVAINLAMGKRKTNNKEQNKTKYNLVVKKMNKFLN